jgi:hypothetical protein
MSDRPILNEEDARAKMEALGITVVRIHSFNQPIDGENVHCYSILVPQGQTGYIVRGDTGEAFEAKEFWEEFSEFEEGKPKPRTF